MRSRCCADIGHMRRGQNPRDWPYPRLHWQPAL